MTKINLREQYPDFYKNDYVIEVPDEVAAIMQEYDRLAVTLGGQKRLLAKALPKLAFRLGKSGFY